MSFKRNYLLQEAQLLTVPTATFLDPEIMFTPRLCSILPFLSRLYPGKDKAVAPAHSCLMQNSSNGELWLKDSPLT